MKIARIETFYAPPRWLFVFICAGVVAVYGADRLVGLEGSDPEARSARHRWIAGHRSSHSEPSAAIASRRWVRKLVTAVSVTTTAAAADSL